MFRVTPIRRVAVLLFLALGLPTAAPVETWSAQAIRLVVSHVDGGLALPDSEKERRDVRIEEIFDG